MSDEIVRVEDLRKEYDGGEIVAVDGISFGIERGTITGLLGPNGAGKSTTINCILGLNVPTAGSIEIDGEEYEGTDGARYERVSAVLEGARNVYWRLTVRENLEYFSRIQNIDPADNRAQHDRYLRMLNVYDRADDPVRDLSRGMKQKVALACSLVRETPVLFLDEPTLGLDVEASLDLRRELRRLADEEDRTIVISSHDMNVVEEVCERVVILSDGRIVTDRPTDALVDAFDTRGYSVTVEGSPTGSIRSELTDRFDADGWTESGPRTSFDVTLDTEEEFYALIDVLERSRLVPVSISRGQPDLKRAFLDATEESADGAVVGDGDGRRNGRRGR